MSRNTEFQFVDMDGDALEAKITAAYEKICSISVHPASPEKLFIKWITGVLLQERALNNYTGNQNLPSRADGANLDAVAEIYCNAPERPAATAATCTMRFYISEAQTTAILVPAGTRATDTGSTLFWETVEDAYINRGDTFADVKVRCQSEGEIGNGYALGQINTLVDIFDYYSRCENVTVSDNGSDKATDEEYYELIRASQDACSTAGPKGSYIYHAKKVSTNIADVVPSNPAPGVVMLYVLMDDGTIAGDEVKSAVKNACSADEVRPLTDYVDIADPEEIDYNISLTYYVPRNAAESAASIEKAVEEAVEQYVLWQAGKLGRDINPSRLIRVLMDTGIKRADIVEPKFQVLKDGTDETGNVTGTPQIAKIVNITILNGGYEDE